MADRLAGLEAHAARVPVDAAPLIAALRNILAEQDWLREGGEGNTVYDDRAIGWNGALKKVRRIIDDALGTAP